jgi:Na+-driven multidrug efflux pump
MRIIASFGSISVAACTIVIRIIMFVLMPSWGLSNAAATLVGQNLGANQPARAETSAWRACWFNVAVLGVLGILFVVFADVVVGWFTRDPEVAPIATLGLRIISGGFPFYAAGYVLTQSFNGAGDTWTPTFINLCCFWFFEIPLSYLLGLALGYGPPGIFWAMAIAFSVMSMVSAWLFRRGRWKLKRV